MKRTYIYVEYDEEIGFDDETFLDEIGDLIDQRTEMDYKSMCAKIECYGLKKGKK